MAAPTVPTSAPTSSPAPEAPTATPGRRPWWWVAGPGLAVGLLSALIGLDRKGFWLDEAHTLGAVAQLGRTLRETSGTMGLYYPLITLWSQVSTSVWWMRALSVLFAAGALVVVGRLAARLLDDDRRARLVVLLTALSPLWLAYAREARSYGLVMLLGALSWLALDHGVADDRPRRWWLVHTAVAAALPLAHGLALLQVLPQAAVLLAAGAGRGAWLRWARGVGAGLAVTGALLTVGAGEVGTHVPALRPLHVGILLNEVTSPFPMVGALLLVALGAGVAHAVGRARDLADVARARAVVPVVWALGPILLLGGLSLARPSFVTRYVAGVAPALALLLVVALDAVAWRDVRLRTIGAVALVGVLVAGQVRYHQDDRRDDWRRAAEVVADGARDGDDLLLATTVTRLPFEAAWRAVAEPPALDVVGSPRPLGRVQRFEDDTPDDAGRWAAAATAGRLWVVGNPSTGDRFTLDDLTEGPGATHHEVDRWVVDPNGLTVVLLEPNP